MTSYLIKSILCSGILVIVYHLWLEREKMLRFNRCFLLLALIFSLTIPLVSINIQPDQIPAALASPGTLVPLEMAALNSPQPASVHSEAVPKTTYLIPTLFFLVTFLMLIQYVRNIVSVLKIRSRGRVIKTNEANLVLIPQDTAPFTFLNTIYLSDKHFENGRVRDEILIHEMTPARQKHSWDILFAEFIQVFMWFNPFLIFYKKAIRLNHEFLADEAVLEAYSDVKSYQLLLLDTLLSTRQVSLASSFNYSITKKRLAMMTRIKNMNRQYVKQLATGLLAFTLTFTFAEKIYSQVETSSEKIAGVLSAKPATYFDQDADKQNSPAGPQGKYAGPGISQSELNEYFETIEKYTTYQTNKKGLKDPVVRMPAKIQNRMYELYAQMNSAQQQVSADSGVRIFQMPIPVKIVPAPEMFENWKKAHVFGIWINGKHVPNSALEGYKNTDIAEYAIYKLYGAALKGRIYKYQLELTTQDHFDKTFQERVDNRVFIDRVSRAGKKPGTFLNQ